MKAAAEVVAMRVLELAAEQDVAHRRVEKVPARVLSTLECRRQLQITVVDVDARIAERRREPCVPAVVEGGGEPEVAQRLARHGPRWTSGMGFRANIDWRVVEVVFNSRTNDALETEHVALAEIQPGTERYAPAGGTAREIEPVIRQHVVPAEPTHDRPELRVSKLAAEPVLAGDVRHRIARLDVLKLDAVGDNAEVATG